MLAIICGRGRCGRVGVSTIPMTTVLESPHKTEFDEWSEGGYPALCRRRSHRLAMFAGSCVRFHPIPHGRRDVEGVRRRTDFT